MPAAAAAAGQGGGGDGADGDGDSLRAAVGGGAWPSPGEARSLLHRLASPLGGYSHLGLGRAVEGHPLQLRGPGLVSVAVAAQAVGAAGAAGAAAVEAVAAAGTCSSC